MKKITIYSGHALDNAYSCLLYLKKMLEKECEVSLWSNSEKINEQFGEHCYLFKNAWYTRIPKVRFFVKLLHVFFLMLVGDKNVIINDLDFFIPAYWVKKIRKSINIIHYNTEIHGKDVKYFDFIEKFYEKHANFPDMIIECLDERAAYRKEKFGITKKVYVINNTCMSSFIDGIISGEKNEKYIDDKAINERHVLVYAGSCELGIDLDKVIDAVAKFKNEVFFLCFCYGKEESVRSLIQKCENTLDLEQFKIHNAIGREELLNVLYHYGDIGIVYYDPKKSVNYLYASPSKFFEYMAMGLNVLSTDNRGINRIIEENAMGKCFVTEDEIAIAIEQILDAKMLDKQQIVQLFKEKYCYEVDSKKCVKAIMELVS